MPSRPPARLRAGWATATAYNRGQVLYRWREMLEGKEGRVCFDDRRRGRQTEVAAAIDRLVCFGGWADKYAQVLGCNNPVAGPYYNFTVPEPTGLGRCDRTPMSRRCWASWSLIAPPLCRRATPVVALAGEANRLWVRCSARSAPPATSRRAW
jgi:hypothetical protein